MKNLFLLLFCIIALSACKTQKHVLSLANAISAQGLFVEIPNIDGYYFIKCNEIFDTVDIIENIKVANNLDTGLYLYKLAPIINFVRDNKQQMISYPINNGKMIKSILVNISYSELLEGNIDSKPIKSELPLEETTVYFFFKGNLHVINQLERFPPR